MLFRTEVESHSYSGMGWPLIFGGGYIFDGNGNMREWGRRLCGMPPTGWRR